MCPEYPNTPLFSLIFSKIKQRYAISHNTKISLKTHLFETWVSTSQLLPDVQKISRKLSKNSCDRNRLFRCFSVKNLKCYTSFFRWKLFLYFLVFLKTWLEAVGFMLLLQKHYHIKMENKIKQRPVSFTNWLELECVALRIWKVYWQIN